jgi:uncharacterized protein (TIGR03000 family)
MRALFWTLSGGSAALAVTMALASPADAGWWSRSRWGWGGRYGFRGRGWGAYPYARGYYAPRLSTVPAPASESGSQAQEPELPQPAGNVVVPRANAGVIQLLVPEPFADVSFNGYNVSSIGTRRTYVTPDVEPGKSLRYEIKASWLRGDRGMSRQAVVEAKPGQISTIDFRREVAEPSNGVR